ncbi:MAG: metalloregulator ArsR/SmtB family transcription factor [Bacteroidota bacterium]
MDSLTHKRMYQDAEKLRRVAKVMRTISHPVRLCIVELLLKEGRLAVKDIYETMEISQSNASQHLKLMQSSGILKGEREGANVFYELANAGMASMLLAACQCA